MDVIHLPQYYRVNSRRKPIFNQERLILIWRMIMTGSTIQYLKILRSNVLSALISTHKDSRLNTFRLESKGDFYNIHKRKNQVVSLGLHHSYHMYLYIVLQKIAR